jgi:hypothetical protein
VSVAGVVPLIGVTISHVPGWRVTENGAGPESLVKPMVCEYGVEVKVVAVKLRLAGLAEIVGTAALVTVSETCSVAAGP